MTDTALVVGSIQDVAKGGDTTLALMSATMVLVCDRSGSMGDYDSDARCKYKVEDDVVESLQKKHPGKVALIAFNDFSYLVLDGRLPSPEGGTNMALALELAYPMFEAGLSIVLISDGMPDDKESVFEWAKKMRGKLDTIFIGKVGSDGDQFMKKVAKIAGGTHQVNEATKHLTGMIETLLLKAGS